MRLRAAVALTGVFSVFAHAAPSPVGESGAGTSSLRGSSQAVRLTLSHFNEKRGKPDGQREGTPALEASVKESHDGSKKGIFFRGDQRPPAEVFKNGFQPRGDNLNLDDHLNFKGESGYVSVSRSREVAIRYGLERFPKDVKGPKKFYVYALAPHKLPEGYWLPRIFPNKPDIVQADEFAVAGTCPPDSIQGVYTYVQEGDNPPEKKSWRSNGVFSFLTCKKKGGRKRQEDVCVPLPDEDVPHENSEPGSNPGENGNPNDPEDNKNGPGNPEDPKKDGDKPAPGPENPDENNPQLPPGEDPERNNPKLPPGEDPEGNNPKLPQEEPKGPTGPTGPETENPKTPTGNPEGGTPTTGSGVSSAFQGIANWAQNFDLDQWKKISDGIEGGNFTAADLSLAVKKSISDTLSEREWNFGSTEDTLKTIMHWALNGIQLAAFKPPAGFIEDYILKLLQNAEAIHQGKTSEEKIQIANKDVGIIAKAWAETPVGQFWEEASQKYASGSSVIEATIAGIDKGFWGYTPVGMVYHALESKIKGWLSNLLPKRQEDGSPSESAIVPAVAFEDCLVRGELECKGLKFDEDGFYKYQKAMVQNHAESSKNATKGQCPDHVATDESGNTVQDDDGKPMRHYKDCTPFTPNKRSPDGQSNPSPPDQNPGGQTPTDQNPGGQTPPDQNPGGQTPTDQNPGGQTPPDQNPGGQTPGGSNGDVDKAQDNAASKPPPADVEEERWKDFLQNGLDREKSKNCIEEKVRAWTGSRARWQARLNKWALECAKEQYSEWERPQ